MPRKGSFDQVRIDGKPYRCLNYRTIEVAPLAEQIRQGSLSQADRSNESTAAQDSWHEGFGLGEIRDPGDVRRYHYAQNVDARTRGQLILGPQQSSTAFTTPADAEAILQFVEFDSAWYGVGARRVFKWNSGAGTWDTDKDMGASAAAIKGAAAVFGDYLVVGAGGSVDYWRRSTAGVWDQPAAGIKAQLMSIVGKTLWRVFSKNQLSSSTDFTTWTTAVSIGDSNKQAVLLADYNGNPHIGKPEGFFEYDGTSVQNRLPELGYRIAAANTRGGKPSRGKVYLPVGPALWQYTADAVQVEGKPTRSAEVLAPGITRQSTNEVRGTIEDLWPDVDFLWGVMKAQSGNYYIVAYDYNPTPGHGWHQVAMPGTTAITALGRFQDSSGNPRLWYSEGTSIKYFLLPKDALNPYVDTAYRYSLIGDIYLAVEADVFDDVSKSYLSLKFEVENVTSARYVEIAYALDGGAEVTLRRITTSGLASVFFPISTQGRRISLHIRLVTDDATQTPRVLPFSRHFQLRFERKRRWTMTIMASRRALENARRSAASTITDLESARDSVAPVDFTDKTNREWTVFFEEMGEAQPADDQGRPVAEGEDTMLLVPISLLEWRSGLGVYRYNSSTVVYDDRAKWSSGSDSNRAFYS